MSQLQKGQKVQLKSGGPVMVVASTGHFALNDGIEDGVRCVWFNKNDDVGDKVFDVGVLDVVRD